MKKQSPSQLTLVRELNSFAKLNPEWGQLSLDGPVPYRISIQNIRFPLPAKSVFSEISNASAFSILNGYVDALLKHVVEIEFSLSCELARLLASRGNLVFDRLNEIVDSRNWESYENHHLLLSFVRNRNDFHSQLEKLLTIVPDDFRDGLFISCLDSDDAEANMILARAFLKWMRAGWTPNGTGEDGWLIVFLEKWKRSKVWDQMGKPMKAAFKRWEHEFLFTT